MREFEKILSYLQSQKWFFGARADASVLFYSTKQDGVRKYVKESHGIEFAETMLVPINGQPVRAINVEQAIAFHEVSCKKVFDDPGVLSVRIKENDKLWVRIARECEALDRSVKARDISAAIADWKRCAESYAHAGAQFIIIFSLGLKLTEAGESVETKSILAAHDVWRNTVAFKEELMGEVWYDFFACMVEYKNIKINPLDLMRYLTLQEIVDWLEGKNSEIGALVEKRSRQGFVYLDLKTERGVIDDPELINEISGLWVETGKDTDDIQGQPAFIGAGRVTGEVAVIMDKNELANHAENLTNKILVTVQTTPHFIPFLKGVKAIVTDEGGITCHAAIISREMEIPCIVGAKNATKILKDGDEVEVDAEKGIVKILKRK